MKVDGNQLIRQPKRRVTAMVGMALLALVCARAEAQPPPCVGDCNGDGRVLVNEVVLGVNIGLDLADIEDCRAMDADADGSVEVNEVIRAVNNGLNECSPSSPTPTPPPDGEIGEHACVLDAGSEITVHVAAVPIPLVFTSVGSLGVSCGAPGADDTAVCTCALVSLEPVQVAGIGLVCVDPAAGCAAGRVDCDGGEPLDVSVVADATSGSCSDNPTCEAVCQGECAAVDRSVFFAGCTGFCSGGSNDGAGCAVEADCPGAFCNGQDPVAAGDRGVCQCQCIDLDAGETSPPGQLQCQFGISLRVEGAAPCDGTDVQIAVGSTCVPGTTGVASTQVVNANQVEGLRLPMGGPATVTGHAIPCDQLREIGTTEMTLVGGASFFGSALGDLAITVESHCR
jgi:hypothetical protein